MKAKQKRLVLDVRRVRAVLVDWHRDEMTDDQAARRYANRLIHLLCREAGVKREG